MNSALTRDQEDYELCRETFIEMVREEQRQSVTPWSHRSLAKNHRGQFKEALIERRWQDFRSGWLYARKSSPPR